MEATRLATTSEGSLYVLRVPIISIYRREAASLFVLMLLPKKAGQPITGINGRK